MNEQFPSGKCSDWWRDLQPTETPQLADLAFFSHPEHEWQVMMVSALEPMRVIGACPIIGCVDERDLGDYLALGWTLRGFRVLPVETPQGASLWKCPTPGCGSTEREYGSTDLPSGSTSSCWRCKKCKQTYVRVRCFEGSTG